MHVEVIDVGEKKVRISEELYEKVAKIAEKHSRTIKEVVEEAIKAYVVGAEHVDKPVKGITAKVIPLQYESRCRLCRRTIKAGELAYWTRITYEDGTSKSYVVCLDCYFKDTALAEWYLKKRRLEAVVRGLKKKADELADRVNELQMKYDVLQLKEEVMELWRGFRQSFLNPENPSDIENKIDQFFDRLNELIDRVSRLESMLSIDVEKPRKRKRVEEVVAP